VNEFAENDVKKQREILTSIVAFGGSAEILRKADKGSFFAFYNASQMLTPFILILIGPYLGDLSVEQLYKLLDAKLAPIEKNDPMFETISRYDCIDGITHL
jgi:hypothetical protein